jgi:hypothetical protein
MSSAHKKRLKRWLSEGEAVGLIFMTAMLIVVEASFVYWLNHLNLPDRPAAQSAFLVLPPWYRRPRFEVTLLLTIAAGMLFSVISGLWELWRSRKGDSPPSLVRRLRHRLHTAASITVLAGFNLALATWLAR